MERSSWKTRLMNLADVRLRWWLINLMVGGAAMLPWLRHPLGFVIRLLRGGG